MKDEIKEILEGIEIVIIHGGTLEIDAKELKLLLDYITNLQQENERLKEENKQIFSKVNDDELLISNAMNYAEAQDYKSRNEKAKKYINSTDFIYDEQYKKKDKLENILNGGDDNE